MLAVADEHVPSRFGRQDALSACAHAAQMLGVAVVVESRQVSLDMLPATAGLRCERRARGGTWGDSLVVDDKAGRVERSVQRSADVMCAEAGAAHLM